jgi:small subunit ribosomal protein S6
MSETDSEALLGKLQDFVTAHSGTVLKLEKWGKKKLQYVIRKQQKGNYFFLCFMGNQQILNDIDHALRFNESVLRYQTVKADSTAVLAGEVATPSDGEPGQEPQSVDLEIDNNTADEQ